MTNRSNFKGYVNTRLIQDPVFTGLAGSAPHLLPSAMWFEDIPLPLNRESQSPKRMSFTMRMMKTVLAATVAIVVGSVAALAQTAPAAPAAPVAPTAAAPAVTAPAPTAAAPAAKPSAANLKKAMTAEGQACSTEADAKQLHGKERKKFRAACMKGKTAAAAPAKKN